MYHRANHFEETSLLISLDAAHEALSRHFTTLWYVVDGARSDYQTKIPADMKAIASARSRASFVHDLMVKRAIEMSETTPGVSYSRLRMMFVLIFRSSNGIIAVRLKKLNEMGVSQNNPTKQVMDFRNQAIIPELEAHYHLEIGYILSPAQDRIQSIELVCPSGDNVYWMVEITPMGARENVFNLWEHRGVEEQRGDGFTVTSRRIRSDKNESTG